MTSFFDKGNNKMLSDTCFYMPSQARDVRQAVIMLHGFGSDGNDLISMAPEMSRDLPKTCFYAPDAPYSEGAGYKWFDLDQIAANTVYEHFDYLQRLMIKAKAVLPLIFDFVDHIAQKHNLSHSQIVLMGFSQGGLLALMTGLLYAPTIKGVIGASAVPLSINSALSIDEVKSLPPVLLTHGTDDDVVPYIGAQITQNTLKNLGCKVQMHTVAGMGHGIDDSSQQAMTDFIKNLS